MQAQTNPHTDHEFLTSQETAAYLRMPDWLLAKWRYEGRGPRFFKPSRKLTLYRKSDVEAFLEACARDRGAMAE